MKTKNLIISLVAIIILISSMFAYLYFQKRALAEQMPVFVADREITELDFLYSFGNGDSKEQNLKKPLDIAVDEQGASYVVDNAESLVKAYDPNGEFLFSFGKGKQVSDDLMAPSGITIHNGLLLVTEPSVGRIQAFSKSGEFLRTYFQSMAGNRYSPAGIVGEPGGNVFFTDVAGHRVVEINSEGQVISTFGMPGGGKGQFAYPHDICIDKNQQIYVSDSNNGRVQVFNRQGRFILEIDGTKGEKPKMSLPRGLTIDSYNRLLVIDPLANQLRFFELTGEPLFEYGRLGIKDGELNFPNGVAVNGKKIYIADRENHRVQVFTVDK